ncbi:MAG: hypothetical protein RJA22_519 [Verrucomicrobiota bacterium]|jgi:hypothetical protein
MEVSSLRNEGGGSGFFRLACVGAVLWSLAAAPSGLAGHGGVGSPVVHAVSRLLGEPPPPAARVSAGLVGRKFGPAAAEPEDCQAVRRYFPLRDGDFRQYEGEGLRVDIATRSMYWGDQVVYGLNAGEGEDFLRYAGREVWLLGESVPGYMEILFENPVVWLDESLILDGGQRTTRTTAWVWGYHIQLSLTVAVALGPDASVPAGVYGNCRALTLTVTATVPGQGSATTRQRMVLSPEVGICEVTPVDRVNQWLGLFAGTVGGVPVAELAAPSRLASPRFQVSPVPRRVLAGSAAVLEGQAEGAAPLRYQWMRDGTNVVEGGRVSGSTTAVLRVEWVEAADAGTYALVVNNEVGCLESAGVTLAVDPDLVRPVVAYASPRPNARLTNATEVVRLRVTDNAAVREVWHQVNGGAWTPAVRVGDGWEAAVAWAAGTNVVRAYAVDPSGNVSATNRLAVFVVVPWPLDLAVEGEGRLAPDLRGAVLEVGRGYAVNAVPAPGFLFLNWVGSVTSSQPRLAFVMQSNLVLRANFIPNPFRALRGSYAGLFEDTNQPAHGNAGGVALTVTESGAFSGRLTQGGWVVPCSGRFDLGLAATQVVTRPGMGTWQVRWQLVAGTDEVRGTVVGEGWTASLAGRRSLFQARTNPATRWAGRYTVLLPSEPMAGGPAMGPGAVTLTVSTAGRVALTGALGDGSGLVSGVPLAADGSWPMYGALYGGRGSVFGWMRLALETDPASDVVGSLLWTKPGGVGGGVAVGGVTNGVTLLGSRYEVTAGGPLLAWTNGVLLLAGGDLTGPVTNGVSLNLRNQWSVNLPNPLSISILLANGNGVVSGGFDHPVLGRRVALRGVVLPRQGVGGGWFLGTNQGGSMALGPVLP